jgi:DNA-binding CsgD family transcriptional regulator
VARNNRSGRAPVGRSSRRGDLRTALAWIGLIAVGLFWGITVLGISIALADKDVAAWWVVLIFGALPLIGLYRIAERLAHRRDESSREKDRVVSAPGEADSGEPVAGPPSSVPGDITAPPSEPGEPVIIEDLTNREREVLALLDKGRTNGEIARELYVSTATVKSHVNSIFRKLGARNRTEAVAQARRVNLI